MARQFKPVRFFVLMGAAAFMVCGVTAFYTHRAAHGRTVDERAAYIIGEKVGAQAPAGAELPTAADLNMMAQNYFKRQGRRTAKLGSGLRERLHGRVQEDASPAVTRSMEL